MLLEFGQIIALESAFRDRDPNLFGLFPAIIRIISSPGGPQVKK
jgi:hypothetical protein